MTREEIEAQVRAIRGDIIAALADVGISPEELEDMIKADGRNLTLLNTLAWYTYAAALAAKSTVQGEGVNANHLEI